LVPYTSENALSLFIEAHLTKKKSQSQKFEVKAKMNCNIYPSYQVITIAKEECYPAKVKRFMWKYLAEVYLQSVHR
jgi:hypothetical protein